MPIDLIKEILAYWGALLSTILGVIQIIRFFNEKPKVRVEADIVYSTCIEDEETKGTKILTPNGWNEVLLNITIRNIGQKPVQITGIVVEEESFITQVIPDGFPAVLNPATSTEVSIQKEFIDDNEIKFFGVVDALGKYYSLKNENFKSIIERSNKLPTNKKKYRRKENNSEVVKAFEVKDKVRLIKKKITK